MKKDGDYWWAIGFGLFVVIMVGVWIHDAFIKEHPKPIPVEVLWRYPSVLGSGFAMGVKNTSDQAISIAVIRVEHTGFLEERRTSFSMQITLGQIRELG